MRWRALITGVQKLTPSSFCALPRPPGLKTLISISLPPAYGRGILIAGNLLDLEYIDPGNDVRISIQFEN